MSSRLLAGIIALFSGAGCLYGQRFELTPMIGGRWNGSVDYSSRGYTRADIGNALTYGFTFGISLSNAVETEFLWNRGGADLVGTPAGGGPDTKVFRMNMSQYFGNVLFHFGDLEDRLRPYLLVGVGDTRFAPDAPDTTSLNRMSLGLGGGLKYYLRRNVGFRAQWRWLPIGMYGSSAGTWCGPVTGCWSAGNQHYVHSIEYGAGVGFRF